MTTVYRAYGEADHLLYVGCTDHVEKRRKAHSRAAEWYPLAVQWTYEEYPTRADALAAETKAIRTEHPEWNIAGADSSRHNAERAAKLADYAERLVAGWPPLREDQLDRLASLLRPTIAADADEADAS